MSKASEILKAYEAHRIAQGGPAIEITQQDREAAELAAAHSESLLRQATVFKAVWVRSKLKEKSN